MKRPRMWQVVDDDDANENPDKRYDELRIKINSCNALDENLTVVNQFQRLSMLYHPK